MYIYYNRGSSSYSSSHGRSDMLGFRQFLFLSSTSTILSSSRRRWNVSLARVIWLMSFLDPFSLDSRDVLSYFHSFLLITSLALFLVRLIPKRYFSSKGTPRDPDHFHPITKAFTRFSYDIYDIYYFDRPTLNFKQN